jgi:hypothetical protein
VSEFTMALKQCPEALFECHVYVCESISHPSATLIKYSAKDQKAQSSEYQPTRTK